MGRIHLSHAWSDVPVRYLFCAEMFARYFQVYFVCEVFPPTENVWEENLPSYIHIFVAHVQVEVWAQDDRQLFIQRISY